MLYRPTISNDILPYFISVLIDLFKFFCKILILYQDVNQLLVLCVYAFAFNGSIDGDVPQIIELFAFGAIASRCALRLPVPFMSGASPLVPPNLDFLRLLPFECIETQLHSIHLLEMNQKEFFSCLRMSANPLHQDQVTSLCSARISCTTDFIWCIVDKEL